jgi:hypothetical protein
LSSSLQPDDLSTSPSIDNQPKNSNNIQQQSSSLETLNNNNSTSFFSFPPSFSFDKLFRFKEADEDTSFHRLRNIRLILRKAAALSLKDYEWRSSYFRTTEAERRVEESLARLMGEEYANYIRPGDAPEEKIGPLVRFFVE